MEMEESGIKNKVQRNVALKIINKRCENFELKS